MNEVSLIPNDDLTRRLLCEVLARMVLFDLEQEQTCTSDDPEQDCTPIATQTPAAQERDTREYRS
jgi:hypothetical protein